MGRSEHHGIDRPVPGDREPHGGHPGPAYVVRRRLAPGLQKGLPGDIPGHRRLDRHRESGPRLAAAYEGRHNRYYAPETPSGFPAVRVNPVRPTRNTGDTDPGRRHDRSARTVAVGDRRPPPRGPRRLWGTTRVRISRAWDHLAPRRHRCAGACHRDLVRSSEVLGDPGSGNAHAQVCCRPGHRRRRFRGGVYVAVLMLPVDRAGV